LILDRHSRAIRSVLPINTAIISLIGKEFDGQIWYRVFIYVGVYNKYYGEREREREEGREEKEREITTNNVYISSKSNDFCKLL